MSIKSFELATARQDWFPIASSTDLPFRHVYQAQLLGREFAVWRADDGHVNVWENRCLHRGVRLSIGINDGRELICQYHGWRYANRTAGCTYIPAHPADAPARTVCNNTYPVVEHNGLIWSCESGEPESFKKNTPVDCSDSAFVMRPMPVRSSYEELCGLLLRELPGDIERLDTYTLVWTLSESIDSGEDLGQSTAVKRVLFLQPCDSQLTIIRTLQTEAACESSQALALKTVNRQLTDLREIAESQVSKTENPEPWSVSIQPVDDELSRMPEITEINSALRVVVTEIENAAQDIKRVVLSSTGDNLPTFQPGAHIDVHLPNSLVRQYSLVNGPGETDAYVVGVKLEPESTGGSRLIHETLRVGDVLAISEPRNNFPLRRDAVESVFIAGGIGVTPLLAMAQALQHAGLIYQFHYYVRSETDIAFSDRLIELGENLHTHVGLSAEDTVIHLQRLLSNYQASRHVYVCGPGPMLESARAIAESNGWPDSAVHFEYFSNNTEFDEGDNFSISLARSGLTLEVPAGTTVLEVLRANGVKLPSSCEQGACGTCRVTVLDGDPEHRDVYLNKSEKNRGDCMMTCVSRSLTSSLTLDI